jgi:uncharacterized protein YcfJ
MRKLTAVTLPLVLIATTDALAYETLARVVKVAPIQQTINRPTQHCWTEQVQSVQSTRRDYGGAVLGTIVGGLIGSEIGKGRGKTVATAAGAAAGAVIGDQMANKNAPTHVVTTPVQHCEMVNRYETQTSGYRVTYEYSGYRFTTTMPYHPGNQVRVNVAVTPVS